MIFLDTHVLIWLDQDSARLGENTRRMAENALAEDAAAVSAISFWEVAMLVRKGRIRTSIDLSQWRTELLEAGLVELPIDGETGVQAAHLDELHGDPADRLIVAGALRTGSTLVTADDRLLAWSGQLQRIDARH